MNFKTVHNAIRHYQPHIALNDIKMQIDHHLTLIHEITNSEFVDSTNVNLYFAGMLCILMTALGWNDW